MQRTPSRRWRAPDKKRDPKCCPSKLLCLEQAVQPANRLPPPAFVNGAEICLFFCKVPGATPSNLASGHLFRPDNHTVSNDVMGLARMIQFPIEGCREISPSWSVSEYSVGRIGVTILAPQPQQHR